MWDATELLDIVPEAGQAAFNFSQQDVGRLESRRRIFLPGCCSCSRRSANSASASARFRSVFSNVPRSNSAFNRAIFLNRVSRRANS